MEIEIVPFVVKGSAQLTAPSDLQKLIKDYVSRYLEFSQICWIWIVLLTTSKLGLVWKMDRLCKKLSFNLS